MESVRAVISLAVRNNLKLHQLDVTTAFLNGTLEENVYMQQPEGFVVDGLEELVCKLNRSLYGLKQCPRCWNTTLDVHLKKLGFLESNSDPCIYIAVVDKMVVIGVYVDDIIIACSSEQQFAKYKHAICKKFNMKDLGKLHRFLGMKIIQDETSRDVWISQPEYTDNVIKKYGMQDAKCMSTPVDPSMKLVKAEDGEDTFDQSVYQSAVGSLLYLSTGTRPDVAFAVSKVAKFSSNPARKHWTALKRIVRYLKSTHTLGLLYTKEKEDELVGYSDSDWAGDVDDRRSTLGFMFMLSGAPISLRRRKQTSVAYPRQRQSMLLSRVLRKKLCG